MCIAKGVIAMLAVSACAQAAVIVWSPASGGNGHAYEFVEGPLMSWAEANATAKTMSFAGARGTLATITDGGEQFFINNIQIFDPGFFPESAIGMWLGGFQAVPADVPGEGWAWVTGE